MSNQYTRAPHVEGAPIPGTPAPNAALLIDFDNVTMGIRSDLSKELKSLLNSDIIKGKVTVQRAYADWRRYPQYIVPLSEASVDLIFAPAYGSSKKNATDIRMAIDGMELVFIRPEIGTFILLTGDSDFSSLVLKLKEYGKFVIGVGIQESSSDILVQNCDEYYSYSSLTGLRKASADDRKPMDPWQLVEKGVQKMVGRGDVMRSDRLKQVMLELDPAFEESSFGFSKFSKFVAEASSRGLLRLRKLENGQYEVSAGSGGDGRRSSQDDAPPARRERRPSRGRGRRDSSSSRSRTEETVPSKELDDPLKAAYDLLREALTAMRPENGAARDSDVKRKMLALKPGFDEAELGFSKFSKFLSQAQEHAVIEVHKRDSGNYEVRLTGSAPSSTPAVADETVEAPKEAVEDGGRAEQRPTPRGGRTLSPRVTHRRMGADGPPPPLEGQVIDPGSSGQIVDPGSSGNGSEDVKGDTDRGGRTPRSPRQRMRRQRERAASTSTDEAEVVTTGKGFDLAALGLPSGADAVLRYLTHSYKGVGKKTAESLVEAFGDQLFQVLHETPDELGRVLSASRLEKLVEAWQADYARRSGTSGASTQEEDPRGRGRRRSGPRSGRRGGGRGGSRSD